MLLHSRWLLVANLALRSVVLRFFFVVFVSVGKSDATAVAVLLLVGRVGLLTHFRFIFWGSAPYNLRSRQGNEGMKSGFVRIREKDQSFLLGAWTYKIVSKV